jgi:hypothetical protein
VVAKKTLTKKCWLAAFVVVFLLSFSLGQFLPQTQTIQAQADDLAPLQDRAWAWTVYSVLSYSIYCNFKDTPTSNGAQNDVGEIFEGAQAGWVFSDGEDIGYHVPGGGADGRIDCSDGEEAKQWLLPMLNQWGYDYYVDFLGDIGYQPSDDGSHYHASGEPSPESIREHIPPSYRIPEGDLGPNDVLYHIWMTTFTSDYGCAAGILQDSSGEDLTQDSYNALTLGAQNAAKTGYNKIVFMPYVDPNTGIVEPNTLYAFGYVERLDTGMDAEEQNVGIGGEGGSYNTLACYELVERLSGRTDSGNGVANGFDGMWEDYAAVVEEQVGSGTDYTFVVNPSNTDAGEASQSCDAAIPGLGWLICRILDGADATISATADTMKGLLTIERQDYEDTGSNTTDTTGTDTVGVGGLKTAWGAIRLISTIVIVGIALFMILSQIFGFEGMSAYTIKKVMPRLVIAVILIQLSWFLATNFIAIMNVVGRGVEELIYAPFGGEIAVGNINTIMGYFGDSATGAARGTSEVFGLASAAIAFASVGGAFGLLAAALGAIIAIVMAIVVLAVRKIMIVFLIIALPLAIALWILPNTNKVWKKWWDSYSKLLMMFPLIVGFLAIGKVFAYLTAIGAVNKSSMGQLLAYFIIIIAYFGPFFMIPKTFKMGGDLMNKLSSGLDKAGSTLSKKGGDWIKKTGGDYAASKYKPGGSKFKNFVARAGTGNLGITTRARSNLSTRGATYEKERNDAVQNLINARLAGLDRQQQIDALAGEGGLMDHHNQRVKDMAARSMVQRKMFGKEMSGHAEAFRKLGNEDPAVAGELWTNRRDIVMGPDPTTVASHVAGMTAKDVANQNEEFWTMQGDHVSNDQLISISRDQNLYSGLSEAAKRHVDAAVAGTRTGPPPPVIRITGEQADHMTEAQAMQFIEKYGAGNLHGRDLMNIHNAQADLSRRLGHITSAQQAAREEIDRRGGVGALRTRYERRQRDEATPPASADQNNPNDYQIPPGASVT